MTFAQILISIPLDLFRYRGMAGRKEAMTKVVFWFLAPPILLFALLVNGTISPDVDLILVVAFALISVLCLTPVMLRRLRDAGYPLRLYPAGFIPALAFALITGAFTALVFLHAIIAMLPPGADDGHASSQAGSSTA